MTLFERLFGYAAPIPPDYRKLVPSLPIIAVTLEEGGTWYEFPLCDHQPPLAFGHVGARIHSMLFEDGSSWDALGGWRTRRIDSSWIRRVTGKTGWWFASGVGNTEGFVPRSTTQTYT